MPDRVKRAEEIMGPIKELGFGFTTNPLFAEIADTPVLYVAPREVRPIGDKQLTILPEGIDPKMAR